MSALDLTGSGLARALARIASGPAIDRVVRERAETRAENMRGEGRSVRLVRNDPADYEIVADGEGR